MMNLSCQLHFNQCYYPVVFSYLKTKIMEGFKTIIEPFKTVAKSPFLLNEGFSV
jgi:hypothetical protein